MAVGGGSGNAVITILSENSIEWEIISSQGDHWAPKKVRLSRNLPKGGEINDEFNETPRQSQSSSSNTLVGSKWQVENRNAGSFNVAKAIWEFQADGLVKIVNYFGQGGSETNYMYKYFYDTTDGKWKMWQQSSVNQFLKMSESEERALAFKTGSYFILTISDNKLITTDFTGQSGEFYRIY